MKSSRQTDDVPAPPKQSSAVLLASTIVDTTWRMFVPTIGLTIIGVVIDTHYGTKPWATILGIVLGAGLAALLVRRQLARLRDN